MGSRLAAVISPSCASIALPFQADLASNVLCDWGRMPSCRQEAMPHGGRGPSSSAGWHTGQRRSQPSVASGEVTATGHPEFSPTCPMTCWPPKLSAPSGPTDSALGPVLPCTQLLVLDRAVSKTEGSRFLTSGRQGLFCAIYFKKIVSHKQQQEPDLCHIHKALGVFYLQTKPLNKYQGQLNFFLPWFFFMV